VADLDGVRFDGTTLRVTLPAHSFATVSFPAAG
jgi:hypothetical protein